MVYNYSIKYPYLKPTPIQITLTRHEVDRDHLEDVHGIMFQVTLATPTEIAKFADCLLQLGNVLKTNVKV